MKTFLLAFALLLPLTARAELTDSTTKELSDRLAKKLAPCLGKAKKFPPKISVVNKTSEYVEKEKIEQHLRKALHLKGKPNNTFELEVTISSSESQVGKVKTSVYTLAGAFVSGLNTKCDASVEITETEQRP